MKIRIGMKTRACSVVFCLTAFLLGACSTGRGLDEHINFDPSDKTIFYRDSWVQCNKPEVHVQPVTAAPPNIKVLFIPFRVTQPMDNPTVFGYTAARTMW